MFSFRKKVFGKNNKKIIFLICGWPGKIWHYYLTAKILENKGYQSIIYEYDDNIISSLIKDTVNNTNKVKNDILEQIKLYKKSGYKHFSIFGTSYGTIITFLIANNEKSVSNLIINLTGADLAETVWTWNQGRGSLVKKGIISQNVSLKSLKAKWAELGPINNIKYLNNINVLFYISKEDEVIPFRLQNQLLVKLRNITVNIQVVENTKSNHLFSALFNLLRYNIYINFLENC